MHTAHSTTQIQSGATNVHSPYHTSPDLGILNGSPKSENVSFLSHYLWALEFYVV